MIRVELPQHLRTLAHIDGEVRLDINGPATQNAVLDALEQCYPMLSGTIRDHDTKRRRAFIRFFACSEDLSHEDPDAPLPEAVASGAEPFLVIGAIAGGCRNIKRLRNMEPPATGEDVNLAALQFVRKISGFNKPSKANAAAFDRAVREIAKASERLLAQLGTARSEACDRSPAG
jgi:sulfur-carrier protein